MTRDRLIVALDFARFAEALAFVDRLGDRVSRYKVGLELFCEEGPAAVRELASRGKRVFLDLKLHDIPETVKRAAARAAALGVELMTVHAAGGEKMLAQAVAGAGAQSVNGPAPLVLAVTVLTSLDDGDLARDGQPLTVSDLVARRAELAWQAGVRGFVASPHEAARIRAALPGAYIVTPGIRPSAGGDDQKRTMAARDARAAGADAVVVGRPIRDAADPFAVIEKLVDDLKE